MAEWATLRSMEQWELEARVEIAELINRYNIYGDSGRFAEMVDLFAPEGVLEVAGDRAYEGRAAIEAFVGGVGDSVREHTASAYIRHHNTTKIIDLDGREHATGQIYWFVLTERGPDHWGRYRDRYTQDRNGRWHIAHRKVRTDGRAPGSWAEEHGTP